MSLGTTFIIYWGRPTIGTVVVIQGRGLSSEDIGRTIAEGQRVAADRGSLGTDHLGLAVVVDGAQG